MVELSNKSQRVYIEYFDGDGIVVRGYFTLVQRTETFVQFKTATNLITVSMNRILKIKEPLP